MQFQKKKNNIFWQIIPFLIIFVFVLIPLSWFKKGLPIAAGDNYGFLDPSSLLNDYIFFWNGRYQAGTPNFSVAQIFPIMTFWWLVMKTGLSMVNIQKIWTSGLFLISGYSIFFLVKYFAEKIKIKNNLVIYLGGIISAALYMVNLFELIDVIQPSYHPIKAFFPLILLLWIKGIETRKIIYSFLMGLTSILYSSSNINLALVMPLYMMMVLYLIIFLVFERKEVLKTILFSIFTLTFYFLINLWWEIPTFSSMVEVSEGVKTVASAISFLSASSMLDAFRFLGFWAWKAAYESMPNVPYSIKYDVSLLLLFTFLIPIFSMIIFFKKITKEILFLGLVMIFGIFFIKGILPPFGNLYSYLYRNLPGFWVFREPFTKFTPLTVISMSCLLGLGFMLICEQIERYLTNLRILGKLLCFGFFIAYLYVILRVGFPLLTGEVNWDGNYKLMKSVYADVPSYWSDARNWFKNNNLLNQRILILPKSPYGHAYKWKSGIGTAGPVANILLREPTVYYTSTPTSSAEEVINVLIDSLDKKRNEKIIPMLSMLNVKYLLQHNDLDYEHMLSGSTFSPEEMKQIFSLYPELKKVITIGELDIYQLDDSFQDQKIHSAQNIVSTNQNIKDWAIDQNLIPKDKSAVYFSNSSWDNNSQIKTNEKPPEITWEKKNPSSYFVDVKNNATPFVLVFSESFNPGWKAIIDGKTIPESKHLKANWYANSWIIEKNGNYKIEIIYLKQKKLFYIWYVSGASILVALVYSIKYLRKNKK